MTKNYKKSITSDEGHKLSFDVDEHISVPQPKEKAFNELINEFILYKTESADLGNIPCPENHIQMEFATIVDAFGKDKPNHFPKPDAKRESIHHVHVFDGKTDKDLDRWVNQEQSRRSCDSLLFYSYFLHEKTHYFYVLQFIADPNGHDFQKNEEEMLILSKYAKNYRESITSK